jgi:hypothetical protein
VSSFGCCPCSNLHKAEKDWRFLRAGHTVTVMVAILSAIFSILEFRVRSRDRWSEPRTDPSLRWSRTAQDRLLRTGQRASKIGHKHFQ